MAPRTDWNWDFTSNTVADVVSGEVLDASGNSMTFSGTVPTTTSYLPFLLLNPVGTVDPYRVTEIRFVFGGNHPGESFRLGGFSAIYSAVAPEPSVLVALGLGVVALLRRRKRA